MSLTNSDNAVLHALTFHKKCVDPEYQIKLEDLVAFMNPASIMERKPIFFQGEIFMASSLFEMSVLGSRGDGSYTTIEPNIVHTGLANKEGNAAIVGALLGSAFANRSARKRAERELRPEWFPWDPARGYLTISTGGLYLRGADDNLLTGISWQDIGSVKWVRQNVIELVTKRGHLRLAADWAELVFVYYTENIDGRNSPDRFGWLTKEWHSRVCAALGRDPLQ